MKPDATYILPGSVLAPYAVNKRQYLPSGFTCCWLDEEEKLVAKMQVPHRRIWDYLKRKMDTHNTIGITREALCDVLNKNTGGGLLPRHLSTYLGELCDIKAVLCLERIRPEIPGVRRPPELVVYMLNPHAVYRGKWKNYKAIVQEWDERLHLFRQAAANADHTSLQEEGEEE